MRGLNAIWAVLAALLLASTAAAQTTSGSSAAIEQGMKVTVKRASRKEKDRTFGGADLFAFVNDAGCRANVDITFTVGTPFAIPGNNNYNPQFLEVWRGQKGQDCSQGTARQPDNNGNTQCTRIASLDSTSPGPTPKITAKAQELFGENDEGTCEAQQEQSIYLLALDASTPTSGDVADAQDSYRATFTVDVTAPDVPTSVSAVSGETSVGVRWTAPDNLNQNVNQQGTFKVYRDTSAIDDANSEECVSELLKANEAPPDDTAIGQIDATASPLSVSPSSFDIEVGEKIPAGVVSVDAAGNESKLSKIVCVSAVDTTGFWDACSADEKGCADDFEQCTLVSSNERSATWTGLLLAIAAFVLVRRRRNV